VNGNSCRNQKRMATMKSILLASSMLAMIGTANAAYIRQHVDSPNIISVWGPIELGDDEKFRQVARDAPDNSLVLLTSPGGNLVAGLKIGEQIHARGFSTNAGDCASVWG